MVEADDAIYSMLTTLDGYRLPSNCFSGQSILSDNATGEVINSVHFQEDKNGHRKVIYVRYARSGLD